VECRLLHDIFAEQRNTLSIELVNPPLRRQLNATLTTTRFDWSARGG